MFLVTVDTAELVELGPADSGKLRSKMRFFDCLLKYSILKLARLNNLASIAAENELEVSQIRSGEGIWLL
jgi:hypothetical protein